MLISFKRFYRLVLGQYGEGHLKADVHWRNMVDLCSPCQINYDYVISFDNLVDDSNNLLNHLQRRVPAKSRVFIDGQKARVAKTSALNMLSKLPNTTFSKIQQIYKDDFYVFGYNNTD